MQLSQSKNAIYNFTVAFFSTITHDRSIFPSTSYIDQLLGEEPVKFLIIDKKNNNHLCVLNWLINEIGSSIRQKHGGRFCIGINSGGEVNEIYEVEFEERKEVEDQGKQEEVVYKIRQQATSVLRYLRTFIFSLSDLPSGFDVSYHCDSGGDSGGKRYPLIPGGCATALGSVYTPFHVLRARVHTREDSMMDG